MYEDAPSTAINFNFPHCTVERIKDSSSLPGILCSQAMIS